MYIMHTILCGSPTSLYAHNFTTKSHIIDNFFGSPVHMYCLDKKFVKILMQDSALLHGVIAYARIHYHA